MLQEILTLRNERILEKLEGLLKKEKLKEKGETSIYELSGVITEEEASQMKKEIEEAACENINTHHY